MTRSRAASTTPRPSPPRASRRTIEHGTIGAGDRDRRRGRRVRADRGPASTGSSRPPRISAAGTPVVDLEPGENDDGRGPPVRRRPVLRRRGQRAHRRKACGRSSWAGRSSRWPTRRRLWPGSSSSASPRCSVVVGGGHVDRRRADAGSRGGDPQRGADDLGRSARSACPGSAGGRRDRTPRDDDERDARPPRGGTRSPAAARLRRLPRAALPDRRDPPARGGRASRTRSRPTARSSPRSCSPRISGSSGWSRTCCCSPGSTRAPWRSAAPRSTSTTSCSPRPRDFERRRRECTDRHPRRVGGPRPRRRHPSGPSRSQPHGQRRPARPFIGGPVPAARDRTTMGAPHGRRRRRRHPHPRSRPHLRAVRAIARRHGTGTRAGPGLGLSIVREIAHAHQGTVTATDAPTGGARFEVRLPRRRSGVAQLAERCHLAARDRHRERVVRMARARALLARESRCSSRERRRCRSQLGSTAARSPWRTDRSPRCARSGRRCGCIEAPSRPAAIAPSAIAASVAAGPMNHRTRSVTMRAGCWSAPTATRRPTWVPSSIAGPMNERKRACSASSSSRAAAEFARGSLVCWRRPARGPDGLAAAPARGPRPRPRAPRCARARPPPPP